MMYIFVESNIILVEYIIDLNVEDKFGYILVIRYGFISFLFILIVIKY